MPTDNRPFLVVAHPGHELRIHGWLERERPVVCVLTDGSGSDGSPRLASTAALLGRVGATPGPVFGRLTDRALYAALLAHDHRPFLDLADEIAEALERSGAREVAADALEGYNPSHDVCRMLVDTAVTRVEARTGRSIANHEVVIAGPPGSGAGDGGGVSYVLDDGALERKRSAAFAHEEMPREVEPAFERHGLEAYRRESLRRVRPFAWTPADAPPFYEKVGEARVAAGLYGSVVRLREHLVPLGNALAPAACGPGALVGALPNGFARS